VTSSVLEDVGVGTIDRDVTLDRRIPVMTKLVYALMTCYADEERCGSVPPRLLAHHLNVSRGAIEKAITARKAVGPEEPPGFRGDFSREPRHPL
jgi:hypothetical protein